VLGSFGYSYGKFHRSAGSVFL